MSTSTSLVAKFRIGRIVATPNALAHISQEDVLVALQRHQSGDWGEVDAEDRITNNRAVLEGTRLLSVYRGADGTTFWLITEADRSVTTVLLPRDY